MPVYVIILIILSSLTAVAALAYYAFVFEPANFRLSEIDIVIKDEELKKEIGKYDNTVLEILHLSDFHLRKDRKGKKLFDFVSSLSDIDPDLIFLTGDLVEKDENQEYLIDMLKPLKAKLGKYAVFGVHDHYNKSPREFLKNMVKRKRRYKRKNDSGLLIKRLGDIGIDVLENQNVSIDHKPYIEIIGIGDSIIVRSDIEKSFTGLEYGSHGSSSLCDRITEKKKEAFHVPRKSKQLRIAITHTPETQMIGELKDKGVDMVFCGHTHGGQIRLPLIGALISGCRIRARYASGLFYFKDIILFITRGLGEGRYSPLRFYCQPEAVYIRVKLG